MSYSKRCMHASFGPLIRMFYPFLSLFLSPKILKSSASSMQRKDPNTRERTQWSHRVLETSICLPSLQTDYSLLTFTLWSMLCHLLTPVTKCQSSFICHLVQILVHVVNWALFRALNLWKDLCFLEVDSMSRNCFEGSELGRERCPSLHGTLLLPSLSVSLRFFLLLTFQLGLTLWERAGGQAGHENPGLTLHGECVPTASLCPGAWEES